MLKVLIIFVIGCLTFSAASNVAYKDCGSKAGKIDSVDVSSCIKEPCPLKRKTNVSVTVDFTANEVVSNATTKVYGMLGPVTVKFLETKGVCKNMKCPTVKEKKDTYKYTIAVLSSYPKVKLVVKWEVIADNGDMLFCFEIPAEITD